MNKEQIFDSLKSLVIELKDNGSKFKDNEALLKDWSVRQQEVGIAVKGLDSCDALWLNDEYAKFFNTEVKPSLPAIDPSIQDKLIWK